MKKILLAAVIAIFGLIHGFSSAADLQVVTVALVSPSWNTGLPTAVARGAGFFKEEGLDVRPVTLSSSGPIMMALLMSGQADIVIAGAVAILRGIARGAPVVVVSTGGFGVRHNNHYILDAAGCFLLMPPHGPPSQSLCARSALSRHCPRQPTAK
ncbi:MAG TPA: ABC transporter substrate-binding protein, partial [Candidatus Binatia bacterium]|nr:ABC transporter substrate-binding protein [Candidatus Binatia bacterium]